MAHSLSAKKRIRQNERRASVNKARVSRIRTFVRKVESALATGDYDAARAAFRAAEPEIRRGVTKRVLKLNTASREVARLSRRVKALSPAATAAA